MRYGVNQREFLRSCYRKHAVKAALSIIFRCGALTSTSGRWSLRVDKQGCVPLDAPWHGSLEPGIPRNMTKVELRSQLSQAIDDGAQSPDRQTMVLIYQA